MKKLFLSLAMLMAIVFSANAQQYSKGDMTIGGYASLDSFFGKDFKYASFTVGPTFQWFFADNWSLGATLEESITYDNISDKMYNDLYIAPTVSYVFSIGKRWGMSNSLCVDLGTYSDEFYWDVMYMPSFYFFFNDNWAVDVNIGAVGYDGYSKNFDFRIGSLGAGISWRF